jgi:hypothetical protein
MLRRKNVGDAMNVTIKSFDVGMDVKTKGIEFQVHSTDGTDHLGDLILTKTGLIWCKGKIPRKNGIKVTWEAFSAWAESKAPKSRKKK